MQNVLIDSDVLLDFYIKREPFAKNSRLLLNLCNKGAVKGYITPLIIANLYYILKKEASHQKIINALKHLLLFIDVLEMNKLTVLAAITSNFKDFEDALQNAAAENNKSLTAIITRNAKDFKKSHLPVFTPDAFLKSFDF